MKIRILKTRDFRGTLGLRHAGEIIDVEDLGLVAQLEAQELVVKLTNIIEHPKKQTIKEE